MIPVKDILPQVVAYIRAEVDSGRTSIARLAAVAGVARGSVYILLQSPDASGSGRQIVRLAEALGLQVELNLVPGHGPAHEAAPRAPKAVDPEADPAAVIQRWLSDATMAAAWQRHRPDIPAAAKHLRMPTEACRLRLLVMGLITPADDAAAALKQMYQQVAKARQQGLDVQSIASTCGRTTREVRAMLLTLAISGMPGRPRAKGASSTPSPVRRKASSRTTRII